MGTWFFYFLKSPLVSVLWKSAQPQTHWFLSGGFSGSGGRKLAGLVFKKLNPLLGSCPWGSNADSCTSGVWYIFHGYKKCVKALKSEDVPKNMLSFKFLTTELNQSNSTPFFSWKLIKHFYKLLFSYYDFKFIYFEWKLSFSKSTMLNNSQNFKVCSRVVKGPGKSHANDL